MLQQHVTFLSIKLVPTISYIIRFIISKVLRITHKNIIDFIKIEIKRFDFKPTAYVEEDLFLTKEERLPNQSLFCIKKKGRFLIKN